MKALMLALALSFSSSLLAQKIFSAEDLAAVVRKFHPIARQAGLDVRIAGANLIASRAGFDPVLRHDNNRKDFDGITYYDQQWTEIKIPTWYGIDLYAGRESVNGNRLNPEETKGTIDYLGVSMPLVQNLVMDKRRAALQQAKIYREQSEVGRRAVLNNLVLEALDSYWQWWGNYRQLAIVRASLQNAGKRFQMVRTAYLLGDRPAIDTLEALTQVQTFEQRESEALMEVVKSRLELSTFLWTAEGGAYDLPDDVIPQETPREENLLLDTFLLAAASHPELMDYGFKLRALEVERRLKFQSLLPEVDLKYNQVGRDLSKAVNGALFQNNYRFGVSFSVPLRLSEGRGGYQAARLKIEQARLGQSFKQVQLQNKVKQYFTEWQQVRLQLDVQRRLAANYIQLQKGEETRFLNGESSLFLINSRELKAIEGQQKLIELESKVQKAKIYLYWAAGGL
jgi:outer membrane protein TolC